MGNDVATDSRYLGHLDWASEEGTFSDVLKSKNYIPFEFIRRFAGAVLLPWDMWIMTFRELYTMCIPLYVPDFNWLLDVAFSYYQRWSWKEGVPYGERMPGIEGGPDDEWPHPFSPFKLDTLETRAYW